MTRLGILFGGKSYEHEISIISAFQLKKKLERIYEIHMIYCSLQGEFYNADRMKLNDFKFGNKKKLKKLKFKRMKLDAIVGAMHGENGEDGLACNFAKIHGLKYLGCDTFASAVSIDKYRSYLYLKNNGIKMIKTILYTYEEYLEGKKVKLLPAIIKPLSLGSSIGIQVVRREEDWDKALAECFSYSHELIIQPYFEKIEEFNLALNETEYSNLERIGKKDEIFSFENKYSDSFKVMHQALIENERYKEFCKIARKVYQLIQASGIIRIDFFMVEDCIYVNEVNTTPGALSMYLFPDFYKVFAASLNLCLTKEEKTYPNSHFLLKNNINK